MSHDREALKHIMMMVSIAVSILPLRLLVTEIVWGAATSLPPAGGGGRTRPTGRE